MPVARQRRYVRRVTPQSVAACWLLNPQRCWSARRADTLAAKPSLSNSASDQSPRGPTPSGPIERMADNVYYVISRKARTQTLSQLTRRHAGTRSMTAGNDRSPASGPGHTQSPGQGFQRRTMHLIRSMCVPLGWMGASATSRSAGTAHICRPTINQAAWPAVDPRPAPSRHLCYFEQPKTDSDRCGPPPPPWLVAPTIVGEHARGHRNLPPETTWHSGPSTGTGQAHHFGAIESELT